MNDKTPRSPFVEHLQELRFRLLISITSLFFGSLIGYFFYKQILNILIKPLNKPLFYTSPAGGLDFILRVCLFFGLLFSTPVFIYELYKFVLPALSSSLKLKTFWFMVSSVILLILGLSFAYFVGLPASLRFFNQFSSNQVESLITTNEYLSFVLNYLVGFGILFQFPLVLLILNKSKKLNEGWLLKQIRIVIALSFLIGAILAPDPINQAIMAVPLISLYLFSILLVWLVNNIG